ncbi:MAG: hypothetical protein AMXMBFR84_39290 [Candidatus Hydrogenedentota bacterium]
MYLVAGSLHASAISELARNRVWRQMRLLAWPSAVYLLLSAPGFFHRIHPISAENVLYVAVGAAGLISFHLVVLLKAWVLLNLGWAAVLLYVICFLPLLASGVVADLYSQVLLMACLMLGLSVFAAVGLYRVVRLVGVRAGVDLVPRKNLLLAGKFSFGGLCIALAHVCILRSYVPALDPFLWALPILAGVPLISIPLMLYYGIRYGDTSSIDRTDVAQSGVTRP